MTTTAREFMRDFRLHRAQAARGKTVRVIAPDGVYLFTREIPAKTCGKVLAGLAEYAGRGFLTVDGAQALKAVRRW